MSADATLFPPLAIASLVVGINLPADGISQATVR
jgi:ABC-type dipeptide/oligopeptide/nickel transport system permease subunit